MPKRVSAGILLYRQRGGRLEVLLVHPGGPYWSRKDAGAWTIPKGELEEGEDPLAAACREVREEIGVNLTGGFVSLGAVRQSGGKVVQAWAAAGDCDPATITSNSCRIEWPPRSGRWAEFPEIDRAAWFGSEEAARKINPAQIPLLERLREHVLANPAPPAEERRG